MRADPSRKGKYARIIDEQRNPITIKDNNILVTSDWHIPFVNWYLVTLLGSVAREYGVRTLAVIGDFWDCDNFSKFTRLTNTGTFADECSEVGGMLRHLTSIFDEINISRGNHEKRWLDILGGKTTIQQLYDMSRVTEGYRLTLDDNITLIQNGEKWLLCHPKTYRQTPLSVARDLAAVHGTHIYCGHGHQFAQGRDRSGKYHILDGGGMFDKNALDYLRETTTHPETVPGFYLIQDNTPIPFTIKKAA